MSNKADAVLKEIERQTQRQFLPIIGPRKAKVLVDVVKKTRPRRALEIGTLVGYSAILIAKYLPKGGEIITLEIGPAIAAIARENIAKAGFSDVVKIVVGDARESIKKLKGFFDLLFIDAAKEEYLEYLKLAEPKLSSRAVVVADNVKIFKDAMADYLFYVRKSGKYSSKTYDFGNDAVEVSIPL